MFRTFCAILFASTLLACTSSSGSSSRAARETQASPAEPARKTPAQAPSVEPKSGPPAAEDPALASSDALFEDARKALEAKDNAGARARVSEAIDRALAVAGDRDDPSALELLARMGSFAYDVGELHAAERAEKHVLDVRLRTLPDDHPYLQKARVNLAMTIETLGDFDGARELEEKVLEIYSKSLPDDHPDLQGIRLNFGGTLFRLGDVEGAKALFQKVVEVYSRTLPEEHPDLLKARSNLAVVIKTLGDLEGARALQEEVLAIRSRTLPDDHADLQKARQNLAATLDDLGDFQGGRVLEEKVLEVRSRTLPEDHPDLRAARQNLAVTMKMLGDWQGARALEEKVFESCSRSLPDDHPDLQITRQDLAATLACLGDLRGALALVEKVLEVRSRSLADDHPELQDARQNVAVLLEALGDHVRARDLFEKVLEIQSRKLPDDHPDLQSTRDHIAWILARALAHGDGASGRPSEGQAVEKRRCVELIERLCRTQSRAAREAWLGGSAREAAARCERLAKPLSVAVSVALGQGALEPSPELHDACFVLSEATRGGAIGAASAMRLASSSPRYSELREELRNQSGALAALVQEGATSETFREAVARRDSAERELLALARELEGGRSSALDLSSGSIASTLADRDAVVAFRRYLRRTESPDPVPPAAGEPSSSGEPPSTPPLPEDAWAESLCAFVLRPRPPSIGTDARSPALALVDLGPIEPIESAVRAWREGIGVGPGRGIGAARQAPTTELDERGDAVRRLVFDPLSAALAGATRLVVVPDDVLHLVPFDALPRGGDSTDLLGDRLRIETRSTVFELLDATRRPGGAEDLVAVGDVAFDAIPDRPSATMADPVASRSAAEGDELTEFLRGGAFAAFESLPATGAEVEALAESFATQPVSDARISVLRGVEATRERLVELAPRTRWLHIATHGWFAPESIRSWKDAEPLDSRSGLGFRQSGEDQVKGMSPMLLCGLALAGANRSENSVGRAPGLITAEEISAFDLSRCELAVLSACDTNVGERRAGQGVASLQMALQMAGARSVITSLWKVPDEATRELMTEFYRRIWIEKEPKSRALWEAKRRLREAKDERGLRKYSTRDWAAWVLTGAPD